MWHPSLNGIGKEASQETEADDSVRNGDGSPEEVTALASGCIINSLS
jgi:hypothetical protein